MEMVNKVEALIFNQTLNQPYLQLIKNVTVMINDRCTVKQFTNEVCLIVTSRGGYRLTGNNLRVKEYGDYFMRIESDGIQQIEIINDGDKNE